LSPTGPFTSGDEVIPSSVHITANTGDRPIPSRAAVRNRWAGTDFARVMPALSTMDVMSIRRPPSSNALTWSADGRLSVMDTLTFVPHDKARIRRS
jgi:hypothetical protein